MGRELEELEEVPAGNVLGKAFVLSQFLIMETLCVSEFRISLAKICKNVTHYYGNSEFLLLGLLRTSSSVVAFSNEMKTRLASLCLDVI